MPTPVITQPWLVPFRVWRERHALLIDSVLINLRTCLSSLGGAAGYVIDWVGVRRDLSRYLYATGHSRFKSFRGGCEV